MKLLSRSAMLFAGVASACAPAANAPAGSAPGPVVAASASAAPAAARVVAIADDYMAGLLKIQPELGTFYGLPSAEHNRLSDISLEAQRAWEAKEDAWFAQVQTIDPAGLVGTPEAITLGFLRESLESSRQGRVCQGSLWTVNQMFGWQTRAPFLAKIQPVGTPELRAAALERFRQMPRFIDQDIANNREGLRQGYSTPRINVQRVIEQIDGLLAPPPAQSPLYSPAERDSTPEFRRNWEAMIANDVNPALRRYRDFLQKEYLPKARTEVAVAANPNGAECYRAQVRSYVTLDVPPQEIHELGLRQMDKIQAEMKTIAQRSFNTSDVPALLERFKTDPRYTFKSRQEIVDYAQAAIERGKKEMPEWFGIRPKADVVIEPYQPFEEKSAPGAAYSSPAEDGSRPGIYHINTYQPEKTSKVGIESTAFHEAIPGHHLQIAIAQERAGAHPVTRYLGNSGFSEGWGLYSERLADEMGLFSSDLDRMGLLSNEAFRAARLVVDPGIHALGWTREQAIEYMLKHTAEAPDQVATEIDRYIVLPGQATAYMIGNLEIRRLREQAERELGPQFHIREFHDAVLEDGSVTLPMLRAKIERWIEAKKQG